MKTPESGKDTTMKHFLDIHTTNQDELRGMIDHARSMKNARAGRPKGQADDE